MNKYRFKNGDKIVCHIKCRNLTIYKIYEVVISSDGIIVSIFDDNNTLSDYYSSSFILLKEYRRNKLKEMMKKI